MSRPFTRIFKADHDKALEADSLALLVYLALCRIHSDAPPEEKGCFRAGAARIARHCGLSRRAIQERVRRLADEGLIHVVSGRRKDRESDHEENRITLKGSAGDALGSAQDRGTGCARKKKLSPKERERKKRQPDERRGAGAPPPSSGAEETISDWKPYL
jgi:DNA-binding MarR family transcriptional regulator